MNAAFEARFPKATAAWLRRIEREDDMRYHDVESGECVHPLQRYDTAYLYRRNFMGERVACREVVVDNDTGMMWSREVSLPPWRERNTDAEDIVAALRSTGARRERALRDAHGDFQRKGYPP